MASPTHLNDIQQRSDLSLSLHDLYNSKAYCDVTVCITDPQSCDRIYSIECHKVVLAAASQYFRDDLFTVDKCASVNMIDLGKSKVHIVKEVISFIYTGRCQITADNIVDLYRYSLQWKLDNLERLTAELFAKYLDVSNIVDAFELVSQEGKTVLEKEASIFLREHISDLLDMPQFKKMSLNCLCSILKKDEIKIDSEDALMKAVLEWLDHNPQPEEEAKLWNCVRFEQLTSSYLLQVLLDHPRMQNEPQRSLIKKALNNQISGKNVFDKSIARYWGAKPINDKLAKITTDKYICVYDDDKKSWDKVGEVPDWVDEYTQCCVSGDLVTLAGTDTGEHNAKCAVIDLKRMMLVTQLPDIARENICRIGLAQLDNAIYAIGGRIGADYNTLNDKVWKLNTEQSGNRWEMAESLPKAVIQPLVFTYNHLIFVIGGYDKDCHIALQNQVYDTKQSEWSLRRALPEDCSSCYSWQYGGFVCNNQIHIFTTMHHMIYNIDTDSWTCNQYEEVGFEIQPVLHGGEVIACVWPTGISTCVCKKYNEESNQWHDVDIDVKDCLMHGKFFTINK